MGTLQNKRRTCKANKNHHTTSVASESAGSDIHHVNVRVQGSVALDLIPDFIAPGRVTVNQLPHQFHLLVEACTQPLHVIERMPVLILLHSKTLVRYES